MSEQYVSCGALWIGQHVEEHTRWFQVRCKQWQCEHCAKKRRYKLISEMRSGDPSTFMTLTVNPAHLGDAGARATDMIDAWSLLVKRIRRKWPGKRIEYFAVTERTKRGEPHLHVALRAPFIPQKWLSETWSELTTAFIVDIRQIKNPTEAANYVAKYVGKKPTQFGKHKRYFRSKNYMLNRQKKEKDPRWIGAECFQLRIDAAQIIWAMQSEGRSVEEAASGFLLFKGTGGQGPPVLFGVCG